MAGGAPLPWRVLLDRGPPGPLMIHDESLEARGTKDAVEIDQRQLLDDSAGAN